MLLHTLGSQIRWVHSLMAGVDKLLQYTSEFPPDIPFTNARGAFSDSLAEYCLSAMLFFNKQIARLQKNKSEKVWDKFRMSVFGNKTIGLLGYGSIAHSVGRLCKAFGNRIIAAKRTAGVPDDLAAYIVSTKDHDGMERFLNDSDFVVCSLPATSETYHLCSSEFFSGMKPSSIFISVGRGDTVDESALVHALVTGQIAGAALDVFEKEPLPCSSELWSLPNVLISSHNADWIDSYFEDSMDIFVENLGRFVRHESLINLVSRERGY